jgi:pimeloyl-ACP methyl ester carboxylesterase
MKTFLGLVAALQFCFLLCFAQQITWFDCPVLTNVPFNATQWNITNNLIRLTSAPATSSVTPKEFLEHLKSVQESIQTPTARYSPLTTKSLSQRHTEALLENGWTPMKAQCAYVPLPASRFGEPSNATVNVFVKRLVVATEEASVAPQAVWLLQGGPGGSSDALEPQMILMFQQLRGQFEVYTLDHRGVGRSTRMSCVAPQAETAGSDGGVTITMNEFPACAQEWKQRASRELPNYPGGSTGYMSTTEAALDLADLIQAINVAQAQSTHVYGISYGTFWGARFMQVKPESLEVKSLILDGVVSQQGPARTSIDQWDFYMNQVGIDMFRLYCNEGTYCYGKLKGLLPAGTPIEQFPAMLFERLYHNNTCKGVTSTVLPAATLRRILGSILMQQYTRDFIPAFMYRLWRCDADTDMGALNYFLQIILTNSSRIPSCVTLGSSMLQQNIMLSELYNREYTTEDMMRIFNTSYFATGTYDSGTVAKYWPIYDAPEAFINHTFATSSTPVLLLNGDLDPQTPFAFAETQFQNIQSSGTGKKYLIKIPYAPHYTALRSPVNNSKIDCGLQLILQFVQDPSKEPDQFCIQHLQRVHFRGPSEAVNVLTFGVHDIFDGIYEAPEPERMVNLYLFIGVESATCVAAVVIIFSLIYYVVQMREELKKRNEMGAYSDLDAPNQTGLLRWSACGRARLHGAWYSAEHVWM